jgi:hypothetical protein
MYEGGVWVTSQFSLKICHSHRRQHQRCCHAAVEPFQPPTAVHSTNRAVSSAALVGLGWRSSLGHHGCQCSLNKNTEAVHFGVRFMNCIVSLHNTVTMIGPAPDGFAFVLPHNLPAMFNATKKFFLYWVLVTLFVGVTSESLDVG